MLKASCGVVNVGIEIKVAGNVAVVIEASWVI